MNAATITTERGTIRQSERFPRRFPSRHTYPRSATQSRLTRTLHLLLLGLLLQGGIPSVSSAATDYYIDSKDGDDANTGTQNDPWKTFFNVNKQNPSVLQEYDTINLKRGSEWWDEEYSCGSCGAGRTCTCAVYIKQPNHITIRPYGDPQDPPPLIKKTGVPDPDSVGIRADTSYVTISGIRIEGPRRGIVLQGGYQVGISISDCYFKGVDFKPPNTQVGISTGWYHDVKDLVVTGCKFHNLSIGFVSPKFRG